MNNVHSYKTTTNTTQPTDAQVLAALVEWSRVEHKQHRIRRDFDPATRLDDYSETWVERMRAALRAAYEEGKKR